MLKSALNYFSGADPEGAQGQGHGDGHLFDLSPSSQQDDILGSVVDVGGTSVKVKKRIGEGGFAFVYSVQAQNGEELALKRLLSADQERRAQVVQEITFIKSLKPCKNILQFVAAANLPVGLSATKCEEFLLLTELCSTSLYECLANRNRPYPPETTARIFFQVKDAIETPV